MTRPTTVVEADWLSRAQAGDLYAFSQLVRAHQSAVRRQLARLTRGDTARADDIAQQAFVQAWQNIASFRGDARFSTWLHRIAYHCFLQDLRALPVESRFADGTESGAPFDADGESVESHIAAATGEDNPDRQRSLKIDVERALERLPEIERVAIVHCFHLDLSHEEAAAVLEMPLGTLKSHVARGKARLRDHLAAWQTEETK
jgi:RNA polymerase sigma factor (sigma-70 family)